MRRVLGNIISVIYSFFKFGCLKLLYWNRFGYYFIERFSPMTNVKLSDNGKIILGKKVRAHSGTVLSALKDGYLKIGDEVKISYNCRIACRYNISIEDGVEIGPNVLIFDHDHDVRKPGGLKARKFLYDEVIIGANTWIGANTVILRKTKIGKNCVIGAGSVIKGDIPDNTIVIQKRENTLISYLSEGNNDGE